MVWARVSAKYEHRWPSRAVSVYRPDRGVDGRGLYQVKAEVLAGAVAAGKATPAAKPAKAGDDGAERDAADGLAVGDPSQDRDGASGDELQPDDVSGGSGGVSDAAGAGQ